MALSHSFPIVPVRQTKMAFSYTVRQGYDTALMQDMTNESTFHHLTSTQKKKKNMIIFLTKVPVIAHSTGNAHCLYGTNQLMLTNVEA